MNINSRRKVLIPLPIYKVVAFFQVGVDSAATLLSLKVKKSQI